MEELIGHPAAENGAQEACELEGTEGDQAGTDVHVVDFGQVSRNPVEHAVAQCIDKYIGNGQENNDSIAQDVCENEVLGGDSIAFLPLDICNLGRIIAPFIDRRQSF